MSLLKQAIIESLESDKVLYFLDKIPFDYKEDKDIKQAILNGIAIVLKINCLNYCCIPEYIKEDENNYDFFLNVFIDILRNKNDIYNYASINHIPEKFRHHTKIRQAWINKWVYNLKKSYRTWENIPDEIKKERKIINAYKYSIIAFINSLIDLNCRESSIHVLTNHWYDMDDEIKFDKEIVDIYKKLLDYYINLRIIEPDYIPLYFSEEPKIEKQKIKNIIKDIIFNNYFVYEKIPKELKDNSEIKLAIKIYNERKFLCYI